MTFDIEITQERPSPVSISGDQNLDRQTEGTVYLAAEKVKPRNHSGAVATEAEVCDENRRRVL